MAGNTWSPEQHEKFRRTLDRHRDRLEEIRAQHIDEIVAAAPKPKGERRLLLRSLLTSTVVVTGLGKARATADAREAFETADSDD